MSQMFMEHQPPSLPHSEQPIPAKIHPCTSEETPVQWKAVSDQQNLSTSTITKDISAQANWH